MAECARICVVTELTDSFRSGIFTVVSSFQTYVLHATCSFSKKHCLQWPGARVGTKAAMAWKLPYHNYASACGAASARQTSPRARSCCHSISSTKINLWGVTAASCNPYQAFPVEPTHSEDDELIHRFTG